VGQSVISFEPAGEQAINGSFCGANGGWRIALIFCFFLIKQKENKIINNILVLGV